MKLISNILYVIIFTLIIVLTLVVISTRSSGESRQCLDTR